MCDTVAWLDSGVLRDVGAASDVVGEYLSSVQSDAGVGEVSGDGSGGARWGAGEVRIEQVELIGPKGKATSAFRTGDPLTFRFTYRATEKVKRPVFGLGIYTLDGTLVSGPNTKDAGLVIKEIEGDGVVELAVGQGAAAARHLRLWPAASPTTRCCTCTTTSTGRCASTCSPAPRTRRPAASCRSAAPGGSTGA